MEEIDQPLKFTMTTRLATIDDLNDIVAIAMPDAVLVAHKDCVQDVKQVVTTLKENGIQ